MLQLITYLPPKVLKKAAKISPLTFSLLHLLCRLYGVDAPGTVNVVVNDQPVVADHRRLVVECGLVTTAHRPLPVVRGRHRQLRWYSDRHLYRQHHLDNKA